MVSFDNLEDEELEGQREEKGLIIHVMFYLSASCIVDICLHSTVISDSAAQVTLTTVCIRSLHIQTSKSFASML